MVNPTEKTTPIFGLDDLFYKNVYLKKVIGLDEKKGLIKEGDILIKGIIDLDEYCTVQISPKELKKGDYVETKFLIKGLKEMYPQMKKYKTKTMIEYVKYFYIKCDPEKMRRLALCLAPVTKEEVVAALSINI